MSFRQACNSIGTIVGPALGGVLSHLGFSVACYVSAGLSGLNLVIGVTFLTEAKPRGNQAREAGASLTAAKGGTAQDEEGAGTQVAAEESRGAAASRLQARQTSADTGLDYIPWSAGLLFGAGPKRGEAPRTAPDGRRCCPASARCRPGRRRSPRRGSSPSKVTLCPALFDWGAVTPVVDQETCDNCWAISAIGALEGAWKMKTGQLVQLSFQQVGDCSYGYENGEFFLAGCSKGDPWSAFDWMSQSEMAICTEVLLLWDRLFSMP